MPLRVTAGGAMAGESTRPQVAGPSRERDKLSSSAGFDASGLWSAFQARYLALQQHGVGGPTDGVTARAAGLVRAAVARWRSAPDSAQCLEERRPVAEAGVEDQADERGHRLAAGILAALVAVPGGLGSCLRRAAGSTGGFDWVRNHLEDRGLDRGTAWRACLALRRVGFIESVPDRPYLSDRRLELARRLLTGSRLPAHSAREWEAALMIVAETRLAAPPQSRGLDAEIVTAVCAQLARENGMRPKSRTPRRQSRPSPSSRRGQ